MDDDSVCWFRIPITGFDRYRINAREEVLSYCQSPKGKILKPSLNEKGYPCVVLYRNDGFKKNFKVHQLVALVFHGQRPEGLVTRHLDGNQLNNIPENLTYGTVSQNNFDLVAHGTHFEANRTHCDSGHEFTPENTMRRKTKNGDVRKCKRCHAIYMARYRARKRAGLV